MQKRVLAIEDDAGIREIIEYLLVDSGYQVFTSEGPEDIFSTIKVYHPDVILMDIMLNGYDGRQVCKQIKTQADTKDIPVILLSAFEDALATSAEAGANDFVPKPFDIYELIRRIEKQLNSDVKN